VSIEWAGILLLGPTNERDQDNLAPAPEDESFPISPWAVRSKMKEPNFTQECITKKNGDGELPSPSPLQSGAAIGLILIEQLHFQGRLISIGVAGPSFVNGSIGPVLPKLRSP
jgi:hypothetical protein